MPASVNYLYQYVLASLRKYKQFAFVFVIFHQFSSGSDLRSTQTLHLKTISATWDSDSVSNLKTLATYCNCKLYCNLFSGFFRLRCDCPRFSTKLMKMSASSDSTNRNFLKLYKWYHSLLLRSGYPESWLSYIDTWQQSCWDDKS